MFQYKALGAQLKSKGDISKAYFRKKCFPIVLEFALRSVNLGLSFYKFS